MSRRRSRNSGPSSCKVFVGNLGDRGTQHELEGAFSCFGPLRSLWIARNPPGFAFVEFEDPDNALDAVRALDGSILCGGPVRVEFAHTNSRSSDRTPPSPERCYVCGGRGHYARDCHLQYADDVGPEFAHTSSRSSDRTPPSPERCYACGGRGHYARDCHLQYADDVDLESELGEGFGDISELCLDPETYEGCDWNSVIELMGIQPRTHNQRNRHDGSSFSGYQNPEHSRNTAQLPNRSDRSWQGDWYDSPSQRVWFDSPLQRRGERPPQQNRSYTPQQSNWEGNRTRQQNWGGWLPQQTQGDRPSQRRNDGPLQQSRSNRSPRWSQDDTPPQRRGDRPPQQYLHDTPSQRRSDRPPQRNRSDQSQPQHTSGGSASHSSVSSKLNDTSEDIKCAICLDTEGNTEMEYLPCGHGFHAKCCNDWLSVNGLCPVCRTSVASQRGNVQDNRERNARNRPTFFIGSVWLA